MLGVTWASGVPTAGVSVQLRTLRDGRWSEWTQAHVDPDEGPAAAEDSSVRDGTSAVWVGESAAVDVAVYSTSTTPRGLRVDAIDPGTSASDLTSASHAKTTAQPTAPTTAALAGRASTFPVMPDIVRREQWGADESLGDQCWAPRFGTTFKMVFVHHTVGSSDYTRSESPAIVRGIYAYHTQSRGWCDIGYNFLVDRYGTVFAGRAGGIRNSVRGAHAGDYNVDTTGISLMGNFEDASPTDAMKSALVRLIAWRMGTAYHGAYEGAIVEGKWFKRISGHRDAMATACPGQRVYDWLPRLRKRVAQRLGDYQSKIEQKWLSAGGPKGSFGSVRRGEQRESHGAHTTFQHGRIYTSAAGVFSLRPGPILRKFVRGNEVNGDLGYPTSGIRGPRKGYAADFAGGSIFWSKATRNHILVRSVVLKRYRAERAAIGPLGFPKTAVITSDKAAIARFQNGTITFDRKTKKVTVTYS